MRHPIRWRSRSTHGRDRAVGKARSNDAKDTASRFDLFVHCLCVLSPAVGLNVITQVPCILSGVLLYYENRTRLVALPFSILDSCNSRRRLLLFPYLGFNPAK